MKFFKIIMLSIVVNKALIAAAAAVAVESKAPAPVTAPVVAELIYKKLGDAGLSLAEYLHEAAPERPFSRTMINHGAVLSNMRSMGATIECSVNQKNGAPAVTIRHHFVSGETSMTFGQGVKAGAGVVSDQLSCHVGPTYLELDGTVTDRGLGKFSKRFRVTVSSNGRGIASGFFVPDCIPDLVPAFKDHAALRRAAKAKNV